jgi:ParB-like nuclease domain
MFPHAYDFIPHPRAIMLPDLPPDQYAALKASIRDHGLQHPIKVLKGTNFLLDGRHRLRACRELGIPLKVEYVDIPESDVPIYTGAEAAKRDGLTTSQRVVLAMRLLPEIKRLAADRQNLGAAVRYGGEKGKAAGFAASLVGVGIRSVEVGIKLQQKDPTRFKQVETGDLELFRAARQAEGTEALKKKPGNDDRFRVPQYLHKRLTAATEAVGGDVPGDGVEALLDFIESSKAWKPWAASRKKADR